jgi:hypothetical protein
VIALPLSLSLSPVAIVFQQFSSMDRTDSGSGHETVRKIAYKRPMKRIGQQATASARKSDPNIINNPQQDVTEITDDDEVELVGPLRKNSARKQTRQPITPRTVPPIPGPSVFQRAENANTLKVPAFAARSATPSIAIRQRKAKRKEETPRNPYSTHPIGMPYIKHETPRLAPARMSVSASKNRPDAPVLSRQKQKQKATRYPTSQVASRGAIKSDLTLASGSRFRQLPRKKNKTARINRSDSHSDPDFVDGPPAANWAEPTHLRRVNYDDEASSDDSIEFVSRSRTLRSAQSAFSISDGNSSDRDVKSMSNSRPPSLPPSPPLRGPQALHLRAYVPKVDPSVLLLTSATSTQFPALRPYPPTRIPFLLRNLRAGFLGRYVDSRPSADLVTQDDEKEPSILVHYRILQTHEYWRENYWRNIWHGTIGMSKSSGGNRLPRVIHGMWTSPFRPLKP